MWAVKPKQRAENEANGDGERFFAGILLHTLHTVMFPLFI